MTAVTRDHPLAFHWAPPPELLGAFEHVPLDATGWAILTEAYLHGRADREQWTSYSRNRNFYASARRYRGTAFTYSTVLGAVATLDTAGLIEHRKVPPGNLGWQSSLRASEALMDAVGGIEIAPGYAPVEPIHLKTRDKQLIDYRDTERTRTTRKRTVAINEAIASTTIWHPDLGTVRPGDPVRLGKANAGPAKDKLHRVFHDGFKAHGRFYGGWWQGIPNAERKRLHIDGQAVIEIDFPRLHVTLAYASSGLMLDGDPYEIDGFEVKWVKRAVNVALNALDRTSALRSLAPEIGGAGCFEKANRLLNAVEQRHAPIAALFFSDAAMRLMSIDSAMVESIMLRLIRQGRVALPVHDSFVAKAEDKGEIIEGMAAALHHARAGVSPVPANENTPSVLHMAPRPRSFPLSLPSPLPPLLGRQSGPCGVGGGSWIVLPLAAQRDLFGGDASDVSAADIYSWSGGIAPAGICSAVRRESLRRGLGLDRVAGIVGISRPQLSNILARRFGASASVAARLRQFLVEHAVTVRGYSLAQHPTTATLSGGPNQEQAA